MAPVTVQVFIPGATVLKQIVLPNSCSKMYELSQIVAEECGLRRWAAGVSLYLNGVALASNGSSLEANGIKDATTLTLNIVPTQIKVMVLDALGKI